MACAWLVESVAEEPDPPAGVDAEAWHAVAHMARTGIGAPVTNSMGRLFDAVASLAGVRQEVTYEGQAAAELESLFDAGERGAYAMPGLDPRDAIAAIVRDASAGVSAGVISARFHRGLAAATATECATIGRRVVVLSGGVFQNRVLLALTRDDLERRGVRVLVPRLLPPNDGGISYGQAAVAAARSG
jgi:hydrogenase maturation protein HypF